MYSVPTSVPPSYGDDSSRKRSRTSLPGPATPEAAAEAPDDALAEQLQQHSPSQRNAALNKLLQLTQDGNFTLQSPRILIAMVDLAHECFEYGNANNDDSDDDNSPVTFSSRGAWEQAPTHESRQFLKHCREWWAFAAKNSATSNTEVVSTLHAMLVIWRNLSYTSANLRLLLYTPGVVLVSTACLYSATEASAATQGKSTKNTAMSMVALHACQLWLHWAPLVDISGHRLAIDRLFCAGGGNNGIVDSNSSASNEESMFGLLQDHAWGMAGLGLAKRWDPKSSDDDFLPNQAGTTTGGGDLILALTRDHLVSVWSLWEPLGRLLTCPTVARPTLLTAIDVLQEWIGMARVGVVGAVLPDDDNDNSQAKQAARPTLRAVLVHMPDSLVDCLADWVFLPRTGPSAVGGSASMGVGKFGQADSLVDYELRDKVLDVLVPLLELDSPRMARRLGQVASTTETKPRYAFWDSLASATITKVGRQDAALLACQVLRELQKEPTNNRSSEADGPPSGLEYIQSRLIRQSMQATRVAHLCWNLYEPAGKASESASSAQLPTDGNTVAGADATAAMDRS